jgi:hypothetical protein
MMNLVGGGEAQPLPPWMTSPPPIPMMPVSLHPACRLPLPVLSTDKLGKPHRIKPGEVFEVISRPQVHAFRPEEMEINVAPEDWEILDLRVGNRSQAARQGTLLGKHFAHGGICTRLALETVQTAMDFTIVARYIGSNKDGAVFDATVVGSVES